VCTTCEQVFGTLHLVLSNKEAKTEVLNELTTLCKQYAGSSEVVCFYFQPFKMHSFHSTNTFSVKNKSLKRLVKNITGLLYSGRKGSFSHRSGKVIES